MLFDLPDVVETTRGVIDQHIVAGRVEKVAGDFSEAVPPGGDAYLLKWIVHDWDDEAATRILTNCRTAMAPAGKVLLVEVVIPQGRAGSDATRLDTTMLVFTGSRERTEREINCSIAQAWHSSGSRQLPHRSAFLRPHLPKTDSAEGAAQGSSSGDDRATAARVAEPQAGR